MSELRDKITIQESNLSKATKKEYLHRVSLFYRYAPIKSDEELIDCPTDELQTMILNYTRHLLQKVQRGDLSPNTVPKMFRGIKWLLNSNYRENDIKWKPIEALFPKETKRSGYKPWTTEEIALMIEKSKDLRNKALIHFQASTGGRVGVHDHPLLMRHLSKMEWNGHGCYAVIMYADEDESVEEKDLRDSQADVQNGDSYWAFLTPEATDSLDKYHDYRKSKGEIFTDDTPIFLKDMVFRRKSGDQLTDNNVTGVLIRILRDIPQIKRVKKQGARRYDIQINHGFRKRTNTILKLRSEVNSNIAEKILGHKNGLDGVYFVPTRQECFREFVKGIPQLTISESERLKIKNRNLENENKKLEESQKKIDDLQSQIDYLKLNLQNESKVFYKENYDLIHNRKTQSSLEPDEF